MQKIGHNPETYANIIKENKSMQETLYTVLNKDDIVIFCGLWKECVNFFNRSDDADGIFDETGELVWN